MQELKSYNNTYHAYCIEKLELQRLFDEKEQIRSKYFKTSQSSPKTITYKKYDPKTKTTKEVIGVDETFYIKTFGNYEDNYVAYMQELEKEHMLENIEIQKNKAQHLKYYLNKMQYHLSQLKGIEYELFYTIVYENLSVSKAVEKVAEKNYFSQKHIWEHYYPKIKDKVSEYLKIK